MSLSQSIHHRLRNLAKSRGETTENLLYRYAAERFLYRLSQSDYRDQFYLKGAFLFTLWGGHPHRPTRDIDFLGTLPERIEIVESVVKEISGIELPDDGLVFHIDTIQGESIRETQHHGGIRIKQRVSLGKANIALQTDIGFGDVITPDAEEHTFPSLLGMDTPKIKTYPIETVIAEKLEAIIRLGPLNSRMKDFYDLCFLSQNFSIHNVSLVQAIRNTFHRRGIKPIGHAFKLVEPSEYQKTQWTAFLNKNQLSGVDLNFSDTLEGLRKTFGPFLEEALPIETP